MTTIEQVTVAVSQAFGIPVPDLRGSGRTRDIAWARQCAFVLAKQETKLSLPQIGWYFGGRDHTTVLHGLRSFPKRERDFPDMRRKRRKAEANIAVIKGPVWRDGTFVPVFKSGRTS